MEAANDAAALKSTDPAIKFMDLFYPESRMKEQFAHSEKYRNKDGNADLYSGMTLHYVDILNMHVVWGFSGLNPVPSMEALYHTSAAYRGHPA